MATGHLRAARLPWLPLKGLSPGAAVQFEILQPGRIQPSPTVPRLSLPSLNPAGIFTAAIGNVAGFGTGLDSAQGPPTSSPPRQVVNLQVSFQEGTAELSRPLQQIRIC